MYKISFFSYKGGSGRSSALVNTVPFIARELKADSIHPIILVDMDMDSTGLTYLLHQEEAVKNHLTIQKIMTEGIWGGNRYPTDKPQEHPFFASLIKVGHVFGLEDASVLLLPAEAGAAVGKDGSNKNISNCNSQQIEKVLQISERYRCAAVIFDSSAGDQETAVVSNSKAKVIVCCMRPTIQFQEGTMEYFNRMNQVIRNKHVILLPNAVSRDLIEVDGKKYPMTAKNRIISTFEERFADTGNIIHLDAFIGKNFGIPLVKRFLWQEAILATFPPEKLSDDEKEALEMYEYVAKLITKYGQAGE